MAPADKDPRPPIELWEPEPARDEASHVQEVTVGPSGGGRRLWIGLLVAAAVLVIAGIALGGDDGGPDDAGALEEPSESSTSSTATTTEPEASDSDSEPDPPQGPLLEPGAGPVFGRPIGAGMIMPGERTAVWVDLDTGDRVTFDAEYLGPVMFPVSGGVITQRAGVPTFVSLPSGEHVHLTDWTAEPHAATGDSLWVLGNGRASLVDLTGTTMVGPFEVPDAHWDLRGTSAGLVGSLGEQVVLAAPEGLRSLGTGDLLSVAGDWVAIWTCDHELVCRVVNVNAVSGDRRDLGEVETSSFFRSAGLVSPDGQLVAGVDRNGDGREEVVRGSQAVVEIPDLGIPLGWLPDSSGLLLHSGVGDLALLDIASGTVTPAEPGVLPMLGGLWELVPHAR